MSPRRTNSAKAPGGGGGSGRRGTVAGGRSKGEDPTVRITEANGINRQRGKVAGKKRSRTDDTSPLSPPPAVTRRGVGTAPAKSKLSPKKAKQGNTASVQPRGRPKNLENKRGNGKVAENTLIKEAPRRQKSRRQPADKEQTDEKVLGKGDRGGCGAGSSGPTAVGLSSASPSASRAGTSEELQDLWTRRRQELESFLLGNSLTDTISHKQFSSAFPQAWRESPEVRLLHKLFLTHSRTLRERVQENINRECQPPRPQGTLAGCSLAEAIKWLTEERDRLTVEIQEGKRVREASLEEIRKFEAELRAFMPPPLSESAPIFNIESK